MATVLYGGAAAATTSRASVSPAHDRSHQLPAGVFGTVASVTPSTDGCGTAGTDEAFTLTARNSTIYTVEVSASTTFEENGVSPASFTDVCVGDQAGATGTVTGDTVSPTTEVYVIQPQTSRQHHGSH